MSRPAQRCACEAVEGLDGFTLSLLLVSRYIDATEAVGSLETARRAEQSARLSVEALAEETSEHTRRSLNERLDSMRDRIELVERVLLERPDSPFVARARALIVEALPGVRLEGAAS